MACKLRPASIKATNLRLEVAKEEVWKKQEIVERRKAEAAAAKQQRDRGGISSSNEDDDNYYNDIDDIDPDQEDNLHKVQGCNGGRGAGDNTDWTARCYFKTFYYNSLSGLVHYKYQYYLVKSALRGLWIYPALGGLD